MPNPQSNPTAVSISSKHWQSESSHATNANSSPSPEPKDLTLTVDPEALFYETEESPATLLAASAKTIQAIATATGPGASSATVTLTCPDGSFTGTGFASHVYSVTEADSGKEIQFFAAATERPKKKAKVPVFMIKTMTLAKFPKDKKRKTIGVSEEVDVTLSPEIGSISWTIEGEGKLTGTGFTTTFRADDVAGKPKVKATVTTASGEAIDSKVAFNVIAPNGIQDIQHPDKSEFHIKGVPSAGFCARVFILPNTVSFMNIKVWEGECTYSADGYWIDLNGQKDKKGQEIPVREFDDTHPSVMGGKSGADSVKSPGEAFGSVKKGKATVTIPWLYKSTLKMGAGEHKFADVDSKLETDASGKTTITKGGHSVTKVLDAVTEGDPWKCP